MSIECVLFTNLTLFNCYNLPAASWSRASGVCLQIISTLLIGSKLFVAIWHEIRSHFSISQFQLAPEMYIGCPAAAGAAPVSGGTGAVDAGPAP